VYYEEGHFAPGGYIHVACNKAYFETDDVVEPALQLSPSLNQIGQELTAYFGTGRERQDAAAQ
jgi:hypothetical protein